MEHIHMIFDDWIGIEIKTIAREKIAIISDVILNKVDGKVIYFLVDCGDFLTFGDLVYVLPWQLCTFDTVQSCFLVNLTKEHLKNAPSFTREDNLSFNNEDISKVKEYYQ